MDDGLRKASILAHDIRFSGDINRPRTDGHAHGADSLAGMFFQNELEITTELTPALSSQLDLVCKNLKIPRSRVTAFVYASPELQATCIATNTSECVIRFSSALVDLLDSTEFSFVCGHELGHFLLGHGAGEGSIEDKSVERFMQQRAQEISVDRIGFIACGSLDVAIRALMKTVSGLSTQHLRFDVGKFLTQLTKTSQLPSYSENTASHPSILVRCRALLWFSLSEHFISSGFEHHRSSLSALDERIESDLRMFVDGPSRRKVEQAKNDLAIWMAAYEIIQNGVFEKGQQDIFAKVFGAGTLDALVSFLRTLEASEVEEAVHGRVTNARAVLEQLIPKGFESEIARVREITSRDFGQSADHR